MSVANDLKITLKKLGYPVTDSSEPNHLEDGEVRFKNRRFHIQVGDGYMSLVEELPDGSFEFDEYVDTVPALMKRLKHNHIMEKAQ